MRPKLSPRAGGPPPTGPGIAAQCPVTCRREPVSAAPGSSWVIGRNHQHLPDGSDAGLDAAPGRVSGKVCSDTRGSTSHAVHDVFGPGVVVERVDGEVTAVAGAFEPAP